MNTISDTVLDEIWAVKDRLSANNGHDLAATCRAIYAEQAAAPGRFVVLGKAGDHQPAKPSASEKEGHGEIKVTSEVLSR